MERKFVALIVLCLTIGSSVYTHAGNSIGTYVKNKTYLLKGTISEVDVYLFVDKGYLVAGRPQNFVEWQAAFWEVEGTENGYVSSMVLKFRNIYTGDVIAFSRPGDNALGGTEDVFWTPSSKTHDFTAENSFFFTPYGNRDEILVLRPVIKEEGSEAITYDLIPSIYDNLAVATADFRTGIKLFGWSVVLPDSEEQIVSLSANDLNTLLNTTGDFYNRSFHAMEYSTFQIKVEKSAVPVSSPLSLSLQAHSPESGAYADEMGKAVLLYVPELGAYLVEESGVFATRKTLDNPFKHSFLFIYNLGSGLIEVLSMRTGNYLNVSGEGANLHFVFRERPDTSHFSVRVSSTVNKEYPVWTPEEGLFLLRVDGVNEVNGDATVFNRKGKYVRLLPDGTPDWVDYSQELYFLPSAHWALQRDGEKWLRISNRSFAGQSASPHFPEKGIPRVPQQGSSLASGDFFFLGGDALKCVPVSDIQLQSTSEEYFEFFTTGINTSFFSFQYLAENSGAYIFDDGNGLATGKGKRLLFVIEPAVVDTYGDLVGFDLFQPKRTAYRLYTLKEGKRHYVGQGKDGRYVLLDGITGSSIFLFRQVTKVKGISYYLIMETPSLPGFWVELDALGKVRKEYPDGVLATGMASEGRMLLMARKSGSGEVIPQRFVEEDLLYQEGDLYPLWKMGLITPIPIGGTNAFYIGFARGLKVTQICLNGGSLLYNGKLGIDNTLFAIQSEEDLRGADVLDKSLTGSIEVNGAEGLIVIKGAAGKEVTVADLQGRILVHGTISSVEACIAVPRGMVIVSVSGEKVMKVFVH
ncbi:MAG: DUF6383 domain-containing protein [Tannerellaceae bacterium]|jgi:hypothetical protein|nr:DUF6383 domain-containing protein [Tannerellaceae bacterium]